MKLPRLYSIQAKLSAVFLFIVILIVCSGMLSVYFSKRHLKTARFFADTLIPEIQRINDLQHTASRVEGYSRELSRALTRDSLGLVYGNLHEMLDQMAGLTATITHQDNGIDILTLNFLSQAIHTQAQLVFQFRARLLKMASDRQESAREIGHHLLELMMLIPPEGHHDQKGEGQSSLLSRSIALMDTLNMPAPTPLNIRQLKGDFTAFHRKNALVISQIKDPRTNSDARTVLDHISLHVGRLLELAQDSLEINQRIGGLITTLDTLTGRLILLTDQYIRGVRNQFRKNAENLLKREEQNINLTNGGLILSIIILYLLHWKIIVRGLGNRLSMISRAMGQGVAADGEEVLLPVQGRDEIANMARSAGELLKKAQKLNALAAMDELTQIYNRRRFFELARTEANRAARKREPAIVLMLDIDHFKRVNDTWGHDFGDRVLRKFAGACRKKIRALDIFARYGGEEFILLMPDTTLDQGLTAANRLLSTVAALELSSESGETVALTVSIGLAQAALDTEGIEEPIKRADAALYKAKRLGRNRIVVSRHTAPNPGLDK